MSRLVRFRGRAHHLPNDSMSADPIPGVWYVGDAPRHLPAHTPCFTERVFDRALAEQCGRTCGPDCTGDCFAELYTAVGNINRSRGRKDERLFECRPWPVEPASDDDSPESQDAGAPSDATASHPSPRRRTPPRSTR